MLDWIADLWNAFSSMLLQFLPKSPFIGFLNGMAEIPYLGWVNWLIPFKDFMLIGTAFLGAVTLFYLYQVIARWLKVIGD